MELLPRKGLFSQIIEFRYLKVPIYDSKHTNDLYRHFFKEAKVSMSMLCK